LWASFFKAETWEAIKMLAEKDPYIKEAAAGVYRLTQEDKIRQQCEAREDYYRGHRSLERTLEKVTAERDLLASENQKVTAEKEKVTAEKDKVTAEKELLASENQKVTAEKELLASEVEQLQARIKELERQNGNS
jgi:chromosome segregation ATPase